MAQIPEDKKTQPPEGPPQTASRPGLQDRTESSLPPHFRPSVIDVPVTPGITRETYEPQGSDGQEANYFSHKTSDHALAASPLPISSAAFAPGDFDAQLTAGANSSTDFLKRVTDAVMGGRRDSLSEIRKETPDLSLSGNIISATFNIPHSLKYHKGSDWVSRPRTSFPPLFPVCICTCSCQMEVEVEALRQSTRHAKV